MPTHMEVTKDMKAAEYGSYMLLMAHQWMHGALPDDKTEWERIALGKISERVMRIFTNQGEG